MAYITINDAAVVSAKSVQTIRRMIKNKKIKIKKQRTPQGFNYLVDKASLLDLTKAGYAHFSEPMRDSDDELTHENIGQQREHRSIADTQTNSEEMSTFNVTLRKLVDQHEQDKRNFFDLIKTFQDRIIVLEQEIKQLQAPRKAWWKLW